MFTWQDSYFRSIESYATSGHTSLPPVLAVVRKNRNPGLISQYLLDAKSSIPVMAYAVARCEGGNVVAYHKNSETDRRWVDHGVAASAVLVPFSKISEVWQEQDPAADILNIMQFMNGIFLH